MAEGPASTADPAIVAQSPTPKLSPFDGSENYPLNLPGLISRFEDGEAYKNRLQATAGSLFSATIDFQVVDAFKANYLQGRPTDLHSVQEAQAYFLNNPKPDFRLISFCRKNSFSAFRITAELLRQILSIHRVPVTFLDLIFGFRDRSELSEKGIGAWSFKNSGSTYEICYQLKYVEFKGQSYGDPWSERQIGVYHRFSPDESVNGLMILLHGKPDSRAQKRVEDAFSNGTFNGTSATNALRLHSLILSTYLDNWRWYLDDLGAQCLDMEGKGFTTSLKSKTDPSLTFDRLKHLRHLESKFIKITAIIKANLSVVASLENFRGQQERRRQASVQPNVTEAAEMLEAQEEIDLRAESDHFATCSIRCENYLTSIEVMQQRIRVQIDLVADGMNEKGQLTARDISKNLLNLTKKSVSDNATVVVVTIITLIYLPTQLVATCLGMNVITFQTSTATIKLAKDFWIFGAFAGPLTLLTLVVWGSATWFETKRKEKAQRKEEEKDLATEDT